MTDEHLIELARAGNSVAIVALYEQHKQQLFQHLYYQLGDAHTAEDLTTEVFMRAIQHLHRFRAGEGTVKAWLFRIARNLAIDQQRKGQGRLHVSLLDDHQDGAPSPYELVEHTLSVDALYAALQRLTAEQREVIVLRFIDDLSIAEAAQVMNKTDSAIKNLQLRALKALQRLLTHEAPIYEHAK